MTKKKCLYIKKVMDKAGGGGGSLIYRLVFQARHEVILLKTTPQKILKRYIKN